MRNYSDKSFFAKTQIISNKGISKLSNKADVWETQFLIQKMGFS